MPEARLPDLLRELHDELEGDSPLDDETKALLRETRLEIEDALLDDQKLAAVAPSARSRMEEAIERFEDRHPDGIRLLNRILEALSHVGI